MEGWYCPNCKVFLDESRVTYEENCDTCLNSVVWVDEEDQVVISKAEYEDLLEYKCKYDSLCK